MKRNWKVTAAALCAALALTVAFAAAAGGESDPLVTLSYLKNVFTGEVRSMIDSAVSAGQEQSKTDLNSAVEAWDAKVSQAVQEALKNSATEEAASFAAAALGEGQSFRVEPGCEIIVRSGAPVVCSAELLDQTDGTVLAAGKTLRQNHAYLATAQGTLTAPAATATGRVNVSSLNVRAGAGTGYERLGTLTQDTVVAIVDESVTGWYMITGGGLAGYVSSEYITRDTVAGSGPASLLIRGPYSAG